MPLAGRRLLWSLLPLLPLAAGCNAAPLVRGTTIIGDTADRVGPYPVLTEVDDADGGDKVTLHVLPGSAGEAALTMEELRRGVFRGLIPGQPPSTRVCYFVQVEDGDVLVLDPPDAREGGALCFNVLASSCLQDLDCGPGEQCDASHVCRQQLGACTIDADCGKGFRCGPLQTCLLAVRGCRLDEGCLLGEVCDQLLAECVPRPRCGADQSCPLELGCDQAAGLCWRSCLGDADCGPGERCQSGRCSGAQACSSATSCPSGLTCDPVLAICRPEGAGLCAPCDRDADCGGPTDFCLLLGAGSFCGRECLTRACPADYSCNQALDPPQCVPTAGACKL
jgi:hypothetical protein